MNYHKYLCSSHWKGFQQEALKHYGHRCTECNKTKEEGAKLHVHHKTYKNIGHELMEDVTVLCSVCHAREHGIRYRKERKRFAKFYEEVWYEIGTQKALTPSETYLLLLLFPYCKANSNELTGKNGESLDISDIGKIISREDRQVRRIMKSLIDKNMVARVESGGCFKHCVNPELYWNGGDMAQYSHFKTMFYTYKEDKVKEAKGQLKALNVNGRPTSLLCLQH